MTVEQEHEEIPEITSQNDRQKRPGWINSPCIATFAGPAKVASSTIPLLFHPSADVDDDGDHGMRDGDDDRGRLLAY